MCRIVAKSLLLLSFACLWAVETDEASAFSLGRVTDACLMLELAEEVDSDGFGSKLLLSFQATLDPVPTCVVPLADFFSAAPQSHSTLSVPLRGPPTRRL